MKKVILLCFVLSTIVAAKSLSLIHYDPFQKAKVLLKRVAVQKTEFVEKSLQVEAIFNKKAYIDGKFYTLYSVVNGYKIVGIYDKYIRVRKNGKITKVPLITSNFLKTKSTKGIK